MKRVIAGFLVAPFPAALLEAVFVAIWPKRGMGVFEHPQSMFVLMCLLFYAAEVVFALPLYFLLRKHLPRRLLPYGTAGAVIAVLPFILGVSLGWGTSSLSTYVIVYNLTFFVIGGFLAGAVFWSVTKPDRQKADLTNTFA